ncbi:hypothetical protein BH11MYX1_BH11MYX1_07060 [soil metagenome]
MIRSLFGALIFSSVVAACGSSNNGSHACGDGVLDSGEQCDDGNTTSGDGCSSVCKIETANTCGNGTVEVGTEQCDDGNTVGGDGCSATCQTEAPLNCGNGALDAGETCDDGNTAANDGCSAACAIETGYTCTGTPSVCTMIANGNGTCAAPFTIALTGTTTLTGTGSGDTTATTNQVDGDCDGVPSDSAGNDQVFKFTLTAKSDVTIALTTTFYGVVRVMTAACDTKTQVSDHYWHDGCNDDYYSGGDFTAQGLGAGTYYVVIDGEYPEDVGAYTFTITATAGTGTCGDGVYDDNEECDDMNTTTGDRCSATCTLEYDVAEAEPNDDIATAQLITSAHHLIKGSLATGADFDLYKFVLTAPATVEIESYDAMDMASGYTGVSSLTNVDCEANHTDIAILDSVGAVINETSYDGDTDDNDFATCAYLGPLNSDGDTTEGVLAAGTYYIGVADYSGSSERNYIIDVRFSTDTTAAVAPGAGDLKINEVMVADNAADTNCDASTNQNEDEFIELVNVTTHPIDLTGVTLSDDVQVRHTFATTNTGTGSMTLQPGKSMVVWGGGAPACAGVTNFFIASTNQLGLSDAGETVTIKSGTTTVATATFGASVILKSWNLNPDITGTAYVLHDAVTGHVGTYSPGKKSNNTAF